jgi:ubiquinone/menaquinone biosynthesis C-methylase UbiE
MSNDYVLGDIATSYEQLPRLIEPVLGYPFVLRALGFPPTRSAHLLDFGCGLGAFAHSLCTQFAHLTITAVDESAAMINVAQRTHAHPHIKYQVIEANSLYFLPDSSVDAAMALFVLVNVSSQQQLFDLSKEVYRVLKPDAPFVILDPHPDGLGKRFLGGQRGEPDKRYHPGERLPVQFFRGNTPLLQVFNYFWPKDMYLSLLATNGFSSIHMTEPTLQDQSPETLAPLAPHVGSLQALREWDTPPYLLLRALKPVS